MDALLTQRTIARYLVEKRNAHYHFTVKGNQKNLLEEIRFHFQSAPLPAPDFVQNGEGEHGRIETRKIWTTTALNEYLNFPYVAQAFMIQRESVNKKSGKKSSELVYGITSCPTELKDAKRVLLDNRRHWKIESTHYIIDWNYDEDRSQIRTGYGPENITRMRRFAIGVLERRKRRKKSKETMPEMMMKLLLNTRSVLDCLKMTRNSNPISTA